MVSLRCSKRIRCALPPAAVVLLLVDRSCTSKADGTSRLGCMERTGTTACFAGRPTQAGRNMPEGQITGAGFVVGLSKPYLFSPAKAR